MRGTWKGIHTNMNEYTSETELRFVDTSSGNTRKKTRTRGASLKLRNGMVRGQDMCPGVGTARTVAEASGRHAL